MLVMENAMGKLSERYTHAVASHNLRNDELHHAPEVLMAVALSSPYGGLLLRAKYLNDPVAVRRLQAHWTWIVSTKAGRRAWPLHVPIDKIAYLSMVRWLNDTCPACTGRKKVTIFNTPSLSDKDCPLCNGSGKSELRCNAAIRDYVLDMIEELAGDERKAAARAAKKLGPDITPDMLPELLQKLRNIAQKA